MKVKVIEKGYLNNDMPYLIIEIKNKKKGWISKYYKYIYIVDDILRPYVKTLYYSFYSDIDKRLWGRIYILTKYNDHEDIKLLEKYFPDVADFYL